MYFSIQKPRSSVNPYIFNHAPKGLSKEE